MFDMFGKPSLITRISIGKSVGLIIGLAGFVMLPFFMAEADLLLRWGILLWYTTVGAVVGMFGVYTMHPVIKLPLPWWVRGAFLGGWMNFVLTFFAYDVMKLVMVDMFGADGVLQSPFWFVLEGAVVGFVIDYLATKYGGEGVETAGR